VSQEIYAINKEIEVLAVPTSLESSESIKSLWRKIKDTFGHADVLINNAGVLYDGPLSDAPPDTWWNDFVSLVSLEPMTCC
jgi:NADP-dependent 3-hydroxy acid dehydrogenase YdfG